MGYLDKKAYENGNSIYIPKKVLPMFPDFISNNLCSLKPNKKRLAILCEILINKNGKILKYEFHRVLIKSKMDFHYNEINDVISNDKKYLRLSYKNLTNLVKNLHGLQLMLCKKKNNPIRIFKDEIQVFFESNGNIEKITTIKKNVAYSIIEEFMILTNI